MYTDTENFDLENKKQDFHPCLSVSIRGCILFVFSFLALFRSTLAQNVSVNWDIQPRTIQLGETATCSITVDGAMNASQPELPDIKGFSVTSAGTQSSMSFGTGGRGASVSFTYDLVPQATGNFTIGPFEYNLNGHIVTLAAIQVQVVAPGNAQGQDSSATDMSQLLFAKVTSNRTNVYNQETFDITLSIYSSPSINMDRNVSLVDMPTTGLRVGQFQELNSTRVLINNQVYDVRRFQSKATALTAGAFKLEPTLRLNLLVKRERQNRRSPFDDPFFADMFFGGVQAQPIEVKAQPLDVNVLSLPEEGKPDHFSGAVGRFSFDASVQPTEVDAGNPVTVTMALSGEGNLDIVGAPSIQGGDSFKVYESKLAQKKADEEPSGQKIFEQVVIPKNKNATTIPAIVFSYFNPVSGRYENITRGPFNLTVHANSNAVSHIVQAQTDQSKPTTQMLGVDILYLKPMPKQWRATHESAWYALFLFWIVQLIPLFFLGSLIFVFRCCNELVRDVSKARRQAAPKVARQSIARAEEALKKRDRKAYFEALSEALTVYFGNRLNLAPGEVSKDIVIQRVKKGDATPDMFEKIARYFDQCEQERYGLGGSTSISDQEIQLFDNYLHDLNDLLSGCERLKL